LATGEADGAPDGDDIYGKRGQEMGHHLADVVAAGANRGNQAGADGALWKQVGKVCDLFLPQECKNYFRAVVAGLHAA
jgi:hypothetical protein